MDLYQSYVAGPLAAAKRDSLEDEIREFNPDMGLMAFVDRLRNLPLDVAQEFGKVFRILPAPDYDIGASC